MQRTIGTIPRAFRGNHHMAGDLTIEIPAHHRGDLIEHMLTERFADREIFPGNAQSHSWSRLLVCLKIGRRPRVRKDAVSGSLERRISIPRTPIEFVRK